MAEKYPRLLGSEYDFPAYEGRRSVYKVVGAPRSGSTLLCLRLWETGALGAPWEYFNPRQIPDFARRLGAKSPNEYARSLLDLRTSPNGVFGLKIFFDQQLFFEQNFAGGLAAFDTDRIIYLTRTDVVGQAISFALALQSGGWADTGDDAGDVSDDLSLDLIDTCRRAIVEQNRQWEIWFLENNISPLRLVYEDIVKDRSACLEAIADFLGVEIVDGTAVELPELRKQAGPSTALLRRRYLECFGAENPASTASVTVQP